MRRLPAKLIIALWWLLSACAQSRPPQRTFSLADDGYASVLWTFRQAVAAGLEKTIDSCQQLDCSAELLRSIGELQMAVARLGDLLDERPLNRGAVDAVVENAAALVQTVCTQLGLQCAVPGLGATVAETKVGTWSPATIPCPEPFQRCMQQADDNHQRCLRGVNKWTNCRQRVPFRYWQGSPFDPASYQRECREFIGPTDLPNDRCPCPDFASERFAGCPSFFQTGVECDIGDCRSYLPCQRSGDPRCSCGRNLAECDLCEWRNYTFLGADFRRASCEKAYAREVDSCWRDIYPC